MAHAFPGYRRVQALCASPRSVIEQAIRISDGRLVVIKQAQHDAVAADAARRIHHEHAVLHSLRGDGIVEIVEMVRDGSRVALVLESFGEGLAGWLTTHRCSFAEALDLGIALARVLVRVHAAGVVHRDLNPQNILYDAATRTAKLIDFDIASQTRAAALELVAPAALEGTLRYMAPEQTGRLNCSVDARSDLYSLGMTLHELFTGRLPFDGDDALAIVHAQLALQPARIDAIDPTIPSIIADLVMKLVAKPPEQRYQTAAGLLADLERSRRALDATGRIAPFALGEQDVSSRFQFPERLYGRDAEIRALGDAFTRAAQGGVETVVISGYSGIGKTAVVHEIYAAVTARRGYVAAGKFDQLHCDVPYSAVVAALGELLAQIVADPDLSRWQRAIEAAVAGDAPLVRSVLPAIERVLGPQPAPPQLDPETSHRRLAIALLRLIQVFARVTHPLVLFLDDVQWSDEASLQLLRQLAADAATESLLLIIAYRTNEVDLEQPFGIALRAHDRDGEKLLRIELGPLGLAETAELVADAMRVAPEHIAEAAAAIWRKTSGNPFFIRQLTQALHDEGYLTFDPRTNTFALDVDAVEQAAITDNVAELVTHNLGKLPAATRDALITAAAIGTRFEVATLAVVAGRPAVAVHEALGPAIDAGMVVPTGALLELAPGLFGYAWFKFHHDRIQHAAYEVASPEARTRLHLAIGRQLLASLSAEELGARVFDVVHHLLRGLALMSEEAELARFAELALVAARRARRAGAFEVATTLLRPVCAARDWHAHYRGWFEAHLELASVLSLGGHNLDARALVRAASEHATPSDLAALEVLDTDICMRLGLFAEALASGRRAASRLGVELPLDPALLVEQLAGEIGIILATAAVTPFARWIDRPVMVDPDRQAVMGLLAVCLAAAYQTEPQLMALISAKLITLSLRDGHCDASARGYACFTVVLWMMGEYEASLQVAQLALALVRRLDARDAAPAVEFACAAFALPWRRPLEDSVAMLHAAVPRAIEVGDLMHAGAAALFELVYRELRGAPLGELLERVRDAQRMCRRLGLPVSAIIRWYVWHAQTWTAASATEEDGAFDPVAVEHDLTTSGRKALLAMFRMLELEQQFWRGDFAGVIDQSAAVAPLLASVPANACAAQYRYYHCLAAIAIGSTSGVFAAYRADLERYAQACPANFAHMTALIDAELARTQGRVGEAMALYDAAIDGAAEHGFLKVETIAHECAAQMWIEAKKPAFAAVHLGKARDLCEHWGARPRAYALEKRRRGLGAPAGNRATSPSFTAVGSTLDFATIVKASHAVASDIVLDSLLVKIMEIIIENTGAQTGSIILASGNELFVHASKQTGPAVAVTGGRPLATADDLPEGIIRYVTRLAEVVVLGDATRHPTFRTDAYVRARRPRSVLCLPIVHKERMIGAVYLENNLVVDAFTVERLEALGILISQLAISIENAMMFSRLEDAVAQRTAALTEANQQLREQVLVRERMESELRLAQKLQAVGQLAAGVAHEINTPIQYVGDSVTFLQDGIASLIELIGAYQAAIDPTTGAADLAAIRAAEDSCDVAYLRAATPEAGERALMGVARVSKIVRAMRLFSHPDQQEQGATDLNAGIENTLIVAHSEYRDLADLDLDLGALPHVVCHAGEVNQVLLNLIVNAAHAIHDLVGGTGRRGTIAITTRLDGDHAEITIRDTGGGIPETIRDRVFDPFFTTKAVGRGSGQGLALARAAIVDRHGGTITFDSEVGVGTTFRIRLPILGRAHLARAS